MAHRHERDATDALHKFVDQYPTQKDAARALGVSPAYLSDVKNGRRTFSDNLLQKLGLRRVVVKIGYPSSVVVKS